MELAPGRLTAQDVDEYYEGFSNATLWPLYHDGVAESQFHRAWWDRYRKVNERFARRAAEIAAPGGTVWVHDYQLQLVPQMVRRLRPDVRIGFFLHIPFPPAELFNRLPWRARILEGLLGADLIGFHLPGGARNFVRLTRSLLGVSTSGNEHPARRSHGARRSLSHLDRLRVAVRRWPPPLRCTAPHGAARAAGQSGQDHAGRRPARLHQGHRHPAAGLRGTAQGGRAGRTDAVMVQIATPSRERLSTPISEQRGHRAPGRAR